MGGYWEVAAVEVFEMVLHLTSLALVVQETGKMICSLIFGLSQLGFVWNSISRILD